MSSNILYSPALRLKQGEYRGLRRLSTDVADKICPRLVIPPPKERDPEKGRALTKDEILYDTGRRIAEHWPLREAMLDPKFLFKDFGESESSDWLPRIFNVARSGGSRAIPIASLSDAVGPRVAGFQRSVTHETEIRIALRIGYGEFNSELGTRIAHFLSTFRLTPKDCVVIADFAGADFTSPEAVAEIAQFVLEDLQSIGRWTKIIFQGTNYPDKNPAEPAGQIIIPRNEWLAWKAAIKLDGKSPDHLIFGDYGADCAKFDFKSASGAIPIRHYRYTTPGSWLVVRGSISGKVEDAMRDVCQRILSSGHFAGRTFSSADDYIYKTAQGWDGPGNGATWREINTTHHITRIVRDIGGIKGFSFTEATVADPTDQLTLF